MTYNEQIMQYFAEDKIEDDMYNIITHWNLTDTMKACLLSMCRTIYFKGFVKGEKKASEEIEKENDI